MSVPMIHDSESDSTILYDSSYRNMEDSSFLFCIYLFGKKRFSKWPMSTEACCWNCTHKFSGIPFSSPQSFDKITGQWEMKGIFCSGSCTKRYILDGDSYNTTNLLCLLRKFMTQVMRLKIKNIVAAPPKLMLNIFGGAMSIQDYRQYGTQKHNSSSKVTSQQFEAPFVSWATVIKSSVPLNVKNERKVLSIMGILPGSQSEQVNEQVDEISSSTETETETETISSNEDTQTQANNKRQGLYSTWLNNKCKNEDSKNQKKASVSSKQKVRTTHKRKRASNHTMKLRSNSDRIGTLDTFLE